MLRRTQKAAPIGHIFDCAAFHGGAPFTFDSSRDLRPLSILLADSRAVRVGQDDAIREVQPRGENEAHRGKGRADMARFELADFDGATLAPVNASGEVFYELGMMYASGRNVQADLVSAHKWFNLAAMRGNSEAIRLRREIAAEMTAAEIAAAQRAARDWLTTH
jgi:hypothetical protein